MLCKFEHLPKSHLHLVRCIFGNILRITCRYLMRCSKFRSHLHDCELSTPCFCFEWSHRTPPTAKSCQHERFLSFSLLLLMVFFYFFFILMLTEKWLSTNLVKDLFLHGLPPKFTSEFNYFGYSSFTYQLLSNFI